MVGGLNGEQSSGYSNLDMYIYVRFRENVTLLTQVLWQTSPSVSKKKCGRSYTAWDVRATTTND